MQKIYRRLSSLTQRSNFKIRSNNN